MIWVIGNYCSVETVTDTNMKRLEHSIETNRLHLEEKTPWL
jgi:hypothetical protein